MLPHKKYFTSVPCPDNEEGECWRPYCHFFHKFKSSASSRSSRQTVQQPWPPVLHSGVPAASTSMAAPAGVGLAPHSSHSASELDGGDQKQGCSFSPVNDSLPPAGAEEVSADLDDTADDKLEIDEGACSQPSSDDDRSSDSHQQSQPEAAQQTQEETSSTLPLTELRAASTDQSAKPFTEELNDSSEQATIASSDQDDDSSSQSADPAAPPPAASSAVLSETLLQSDILKNLVNEAVKKYIGENPLLANVEPSVILGKINTTAIAESISASTTSVKADHATHSADAGNGGKKRRLYLRPPGIPDYKPTPISELNRRKSAEKGASSVLSQILSSDYSPKKRHDSETTDFSSAEDDEEKINSEFDMLEEVIAETSKSNSDKYNNKEFRKRKRALGKLKNHRTASSTDTNKSFEDSDNTIKSDSSAIDFKTCKAVESKAGSAPEENQMDSEDSFPKPHIAVHVIPQVTRKPWTPSIKKVQPVQRSTSDMLEATLEALDGVSAPRKTLSANYQPPAETVKIADLNKEIESLTRDALCETDSSTKTDSNIECQELGTIQGDQSCDNTKDLGKSLDGLEKPTKEKDSTKNKVSDSNEKMNRDGPINRDKEEKEDINDNESNSSQDSSCKSRKGGKEEITKKDDKEDPSIGSVLSDKLKSADEQEQLREQNTSDYDSDDSRSRKRASRSHDRSSSREYHRKKRKRKDKKRKHSKSKKKKKRRSYSSDYDSDATSDTNRENENAADEEVKIKKEKTEDTSRSSDSDSSQTRIEIKLEKGAENDEGDGSGLDSKKDRSRSRKRKRSKHRRKSKRKYKKRRYRSSSSYDSSSSSNSRCRKRRRKGIDLSLVKQEDSEVIDLTVIKDESDSDSDQPLVVSSSIKKENDKKESSHRKTRDSSQSPIETMKDIKTEDAKCSSQSEVVCEKSSEESPSCEVVPEAKKESKGKEKAQEHGKAQRDGKTQNAEVNEDGKIRHRSQSGAGSRSSKSRTASLDSNHSSNTVPFDTDTELTQEFPPSPDTPQTFTSISDQMLPSDKASIYSSKTKTLTEISIFDALAGNTSSSIKTIKKKRVEELSSSSLTPTVTDEEDVLKKITSTTTTSSHRSSSSSTSKSRTKTSSSKHVSKSTNSSHRGSSSRHSSSSSKNSTSKSSSGSSSVADKDGRIKSSQDLKKSSFSTGDVSSTKTHDSSTKDSKDKSKSSSSSSDKRHKSSHGSSGHSSQLSPKSSSKDDKRSSKSTSAKDGKSSGNTSSRSGGHSGGSQEKARRRSSISSKSSKTPPSQESEGISDREPFAFNASVSSDEYGGSVGGCSPLPDLSALDTIPEEDWDQLVSSTDHNDDDDDNVTEAAEFECLKLYNDFQQPPTPPPQQQKRGGPVSRASSSSSSGGGEPTLLSDSAASRHSQRVAHAGAQGNLLRRPNLAGVPHRKKTPDQVMMERYAILRAKEAELKQLLAARRKEEGSEGDLRPPDRRGSGPPAATTAAATSAFPLGGGNSSKKPRIGAVSNVSALLNASKSLQGRLADASSASRPSPSSASKYKAVGTARVSSTPAAAAAAPTLATAGAIGAKRIAHVPKSDVLSRPIIASEFGGKVPQNIRQRYLNSFIDEAVKFADGETEAFRIAVCEEKVCYRRAGSRAVYLSLAVNTKKRLRGGTVSDQAKELMDIESETAAALPIASTSKAAVTASPSLPANPRVQSHFSTMAGGGQKGSWSIEKPVKLSIDKKIDSLKGAKLFQYIQRYLLTPEQLEENGYPRPHPEIKGKAVIKVESRKRISPSPTERYCARCHVLYLVDKWGFPRTITRCVYHWGRAGKRRGPTGFESRYSCCQGDGESEGCCLASTHVSDNFNPNELTGFVRTLPKPPDSSGDHGVYALDCEMSYTTNGNELTRITVVAHDNSIVYESFVQPDNQILDYNTRFSGISEEDLEGVTTTLRDVQAALLARFSASTVLIGHSLESDLMALKIIHSTVIDTAVMFPHKMGPPYKRALRNLASDHLKKIIQNDVGGHDSAEDAITCMELLHWRIKEDLKTGVAT